MITRLFGRQHIQVCNAGLEAPLGSRPVVYLKRVWAGTQGGL